MNTGSTELVMNLLNAAQAGDRTALSKLYEFLYQDLRLLARSRLRRNYPLTQLDTTALVHESFMRLVNANQLNIDSRTHFFAYAARVMRSIIIDFIRHKQAERRGGGGVHVTLNTDIADSVPECEDEVVRVSEALDELESIDARAVQVVEMRYFAGMTEAEIAQVLGVTERTVRRDWQKARLLLKAALG